MEKVLGAYRHGAGADDLPSDAEAARALIPPGTAAVRDFSYIAPDFPAFDGRELRRLHGVRYGLPGQRRAGEGDRASRTSRKSLRRLPTRPIVSGCTGASPRRRSTSASSRSAAKKAACSASSSTRRSARAAANASRSAARTRRYRWSARRRRRWKPTSARSPSSASCRTRRQSTSAARRSLT